MPGLSRGDRPVRLDGGFATPEVFEFLDEQRVEYAVGMAKNTVLEAFGEPLMKQARRLSKASGETAHLYGECRYAARSWDDERRVIIKAEVVRHLGCKVKDNPRFVVTNIPRVPKNVYEKIYCRRALIENRIKELLTACTSTARVARALLPISYGSCSAPLPMCCFRSCGCRRSGPAWPPPRSARCGSACSSWRCGWNVLPGDWCCICRTRHRGARTGAASRAHSAPYRSDALLHTDAR